MNPGITVRPCASMRCTPDGAAPDPTDTILPPRTTTAPRSMTPPLPSGIRALTMARSCAPASAGTVSRNVRAMSAITVFMERNYIRRKRCVRLSRTSGRAIRDEVASAGDLRHVFGRAHERNEVEHRIDGSAQDSLAAHRPAYGHERDDAANPRGGSIQSACHPPLSILTELVSHTHAHVRATSVPPSIE